MASQPIVYYNGQFLPENKVHISPNDRGFMFADGTYEVFRAFHGKLLFAEEHIERLRYSLRELRIEFTEFNSIIPAVKKLIDLNKLSDRESTIYLQITRGVYRRMHPFPDEMPEPTIIIFAKEFFPYTEKLQKGVKCITAEDIRWHRCDIKTIALLPNILNKQKAVEEGAYEAIFIRDKFITEGTHTNVFGVIDGIIYTHPKSNLILSGISREIVIKLCRENRLKLKEKAIHEKRIPELSELMVVGTSTEVMPVIQLNDFPISQQIPGPYTRRLQKLYKDFINNYLESQAKQNGGLIRV